MPPKYFSDKGDQPPFLKALAEVRRIAVAAFAFFPTFISSCGFGFIRTSAPISRFVSANVSDGGLVIMSPNIWEIISREIFRRRHASVSEPKEVLSTAKEGEDGSIHFSFDGPQTIEAANAFHLSYGHTMSAWGMLESQLFHWFFYISGIGNESMARAIYYSAKSFNARADMLEEVLRVATLNEGQAPFLKGAIKKARTYSSFRNSATHGEPIPVIVEEAAPLMAFALVQGKKQEGGLNISIAYLDNATENFTVLWSLIRRAHPSHQEDATQLLATSLAQIQALPSLPYSKSDQNS